MNDITKNFKSQKKRERTNRRNAKFFRKEQSTNDQLAKKMFGKSFLSLTQEQQRAVILRKLGRVHHNE